MVDAFKKYWPLALAAVTVIGGISAAGRFQSQLEFITKAVNPDTIVEYRVEEAKRETIKGLRWCFGKAKVQGKTLAEALDCLD